MLASKPAYRLGVDIGSTTTKLALLDDSGRWVFSSYARHRADIAKSLLDMLGQARQQLGDIEVAACVTGSGGLAIAEAMGLPFEQEVVSCKNAVRAKAEQVDCVIELGGEDAKIIFFDEHGIEQRMNGSCAGGTGAFIDQMAALLGTDAAGLDRLAGGYEHLHPIASRCGVFAKSDVQPLLNEGAKREDIAASIMQAVVNQTIGSLACGHSIQGKVAFLGGPLTYLPSLRERFVETLGLGAQDVVSIEHPHLVVAYGAALCAGERGEAPVSLAQLERSCRVAQEALAHTIARLPPLFASEGDRAVFEARHGACSIGEADLGSYTGNAYLGIDAGSTTFKLVLAAEDGSILYQCYRDNGGDVLQCAREELAKLYGELERSCAGAVDIACSAVTGYGEALLESALRLDFGEVETVAHLRAAREIEPEVDVVLDIGGQDMKYIKARDGAIDDILLNEACSSGCGSFLKTYADSMGITLERFVELALRSRNPVDLGSRCTVFMNSRIKQAQKEGAALEDLAAGLCYSVVRNALRKVIRASDPSALGSKVLVQGGTFSNDAVLRAFELVCGTEVIRPAIPALMGAWGASLLARDRYRVFGSKTSMLDAEQLQRLEVRQSRMRCKRCENACDLVVNAFAVDNGQTERFVTGNRCERGAASSGARDDIPNLLAYKARRVFEYEPLSAERVERGVVGMPRALNMYENYPFWFTFFTELGFQVVLSAANSRSTFLTGLPSVPSESVCYPAKLSHGAVEDLVERGVDFVWMPCIRHERQEDDGAMNCFNCPIVSSYPETLRLNVESLDKAGIPLLDPYLPYRDPKRLEDRMYEVLLGLYGQLGSSRLHDPVFERPAGLRGAPPTRGQVKRAIAAAYSADDAWHEDMRKAGERAIAWLHEHDARGIVLAGRPYHADPEVNHGIATLANSLGLAVLTEDSVAWMARPERELRAADQWMYHTRLYDAAKLVTREPSLELVQLNSFGCGIDAITTDQVREIIEGSGKLYTCLKIDEVSNLGAARIRLRSLLAAMRQKGRDAGVETSTAFARTAFTKEMRAEGYTIIAPQMSPVHFTLLEAAFRAQGYRLEILPAIDQKAIDCGLSCVNNDICYPSVLVVGQVMEAIESGRYDTSKTAILMVQTGGGCRATNYIGLIRKALAERGLAHVPVISLSAAKTGEDNPGWAYSIELLRHASCAVVLGDLLLTCLNCTRPYEARPGSADELCRSLLAQSAEMIPTMGRKAFKEQCAAIVSAFDVLELVEACPKPRAGIVGEILVKYHPTGNNQLVETLEREGCEAVVLGLGDFFQYVALNMGFQHRFLDRALPSAVGGDLLYRFIDWMRADASKALAASRRFDAPHDMAKLALKAQETLQLCNNMGEGWLLAAEIIGLVESGVPNIVICSPFGCLPNHVVGKGVVRDLKKRYPELNVAIVDYDPGVSEVNQLNRIKLMTSEARSRLASQAEPVSKTAR